MRTAGGPLNLPTLGDFEDLLLQNWGLGGSNADHTIKLWTVKTGECLSTLNGHHNSVWLVAFSPDGQTLASGSDDKTIKLWATATGQCLNTLKTQAPYDGMDITGVVGLTEA